MKKNVLALLVLIAVPSAVVLAADDELDSLRQSRPFIRGGVYDKPFMLQPFGRTAIGGYLETVWKMERARGITEEISFEARRVNLFVHSMVSERVRFFAEIEFEHGTEEIAVEFASIDFEIHPALVYRGGILLSPLGRFNLTHDSPLNEFTDRSLVSTQIIPSALSEVGMGFYGAFYPSASSRLTYELYAVNGFHDGVITAGPGTRIREGRGGFEEDNNPAPSFVGRAAFSPRADAEFGVSVHTGPYNRYKVEQFFVDEKRNLTIAAFDWEFSLFDFEFEGEYARASINIPPSLRGLFAERQQGIYAQSGYRFGEGLIGALQSSSMMFALRYEFVDFDMDVGGDAHQRFSVGYNFRPTSDTVFKLDYHHDWEWSRVNVLERKAGINFSVASYF